MILFFYGDDSFRIHQQIKKLKEKFITASLGDTNLSIIEAKNATYNDIVRQVLAVPFLSKTRLVIIENVLSEASKETQEKLNEFLKKVPSSTVLVFAQTKPDKRLALYKKLIKADKVMEFPLLEPDELRRWVKKEIEKRGGEIDAQALTTLINYVGSDLWRMSNEIDKLTAYCLPSTANRQPQKGIIDSQSQPSGRQKTEDGTTAITVENIELLVHSQIDKDIFRMVDAVANKNLNQALKEVNALEKAGENNLYILTMIIYQYRNLLILKDLKENFKIHSSYDLSRKSGIHPYVVGKTMRQLNNFTLASLKKSYRHLLDFDAAIKTGKIESKTAMTLLLAKLIRE